MHLRFLRLVCKAIVRFEGNSRRWQRVLEKSNAKKSVVCPLSVRIPLYFIYTGRAKNIASYDLLPITHQRFKLIL